MMKWFGMAPFAVLCDDCERVPIPVGELCSWCGEAIESCDDGVMMLHLGSEGSTYRPRHSECDLRSVIGGINHLRGVCTCCGGTEPPDPPNMTRRKAALLAAAVHCRENM